MSPSRVLVLLVIIAVFAALGTAAGIYVQTLRLVEKPQEFRSLGALVVGAAFSAPQSSAAGSSQAMDDLYGTIIETLGSQEMHRDAIERIKALYPELEHSRVQIKASRVKGSGIIKVLATGSEPRYTRVFLDALLDEGIAHRQRILGQSQENKGDYVAIQERASVAAEHVEDWKLSVITGRLAGGVGGALLGLFLGLLIVRAPAAPSFSQTD